MAATCLLPIATATASMVVITCAWLAVQRLWQRQFPGQGDGDALAGRSGCHGCNCSPETCEREFAPDNNPKEVT